MPEGKEQFANLTAARESAKNLKWRAVETLDQQLESFELNFTNRGGKVIWAEDAGQAIEAVLQICIAANCKTLVKSKSMVTEEIHLNAAMEQNGIAASTNCRSGVCGWCHSRLVSGNVYVPKEVDGRRMADLQYGYVHPCSTFPLSDIEIDVPPFRL